MNNKIEWAEPPAAINRKWRFIIEQLESRPGSWALIGRMSISTAYTYSKRYNLELRLGPKEGNQADVYFRVPEPAKTVDDVTATSPLLASAAN
jgi:hypothetical protein